MDVAIHNVATIKIEHDTLPNGMHIIRNVYRDEDGDKIGETTIFGPNDGRNINIELERS